MGGYEKREQPDDETRALIAMVEARRGPGQGAGCPYIQQWFADHIATPVAEIERLALRFSRLATPPKQAVDYIVPIVGRAWTAVDAWQHGGAAAIAPELAAAGLATDTGVQVQPRGGVAPTGTTAKPVGPDVGRIVAVSAPGNNPYYNKHELTAKATLGVTDDEPHALALAKTLGTDVAIVPSGGHYYLYAIAGQADVIAGAPLDLMPGYAERAGLRVEPGVAAVVNRHGATYRAADLAAPTDNARASIGASADPFQAYKDLHQARGGIDALAEPELVATMHGAMVDTALSMLATSEAQARAKASQLGTPGATSAGEHQQIEDTARQVLPIQRDIEQRRMFMAMSAQGSTRQWTEQQQAEIVVKNAAANTSLDPEGGILPADARQSWGWLVVAWGGVALGFADVLKAKQVAEEVGKVARGSKTVAEAADALARGDKQLLEQLRLAAGDAKLTETITEALQPGLGRRIGAEISVDARLGADVQVLYQVDERGRTFVTAVKVGPNAKVGDILAHAGTVKALDRYSGLAGKCRDLWDRIRSFAGMGRAAEQPFETGSKAAESYQELQKLDKLISYRRAMIQEMLEKSPSATDAQAVLRKEIAYLEHEVDLHARVVDALVNERGKGVVAMSNGTEDALKAGHRLPDFPTKGAGELTEEELKHSAYYFERNADGTFTRKTRSLEEAGSPSRPNRSIPRRSSTAGFRSASRVAASSANLVRQPKEGWREQGYGTLRSAFRGAQQPVVAPTPGWRSISGE